MSVLTLIWRELAHRRWNFLLSTAGVWITATLFVAFLTLAEAARRETTRVTRDMGFNLRIIPRGTDMAVFWAQGYPDRTMPEETVRRLASYDRVFVSFNHLVATLQRRFPLGGKDVLLTGLAPTIAAPEQRTRPMGYALEPGTVIVGSQAAQWLGLKKGATIEMGGRSFIVQRCLAESGTDEDIRVYAALEDVQRALGLPGLINEIKAIDCLCLTADKNPLDILRAELDRALPEAMVLQLRTMADARARQRQTIDKFAGFLLPLLMLACAGWVCVLAVLNLRERRVELGLLRSLGHGSGLIAGLFIGKAVLVAALGATLGWAAGSALALHFGQQIFPVTVQAIRTEPFLLAQMLVGAVALVTTATVIPASMAVALDPAEVLREE